jgi:hypothetical protein
VTGSHLIGKISAIGPGRLARRRARFACVGILFVASVGKGQFAKTGLVLSSKFEQFILGGFRLPNVPGIVMTIFMDSLLVTVIALAIVWQHIAGRRLGCQVRNTRSR